MIEQEERLALDLSNWKEKTSQQIVEDFASALLEQRESSLEERITFYRLEVNSEGKLESPSFGLVEKHLRDETELDKLENESVIKLTKWANNEEEGTAIWISPRSEIYDESRFVIFEIETSQNKKTLNCRAVCGKQDQKDCLAIAEQLLAFSNLEKGLEEIDELRANIIPLIIQRPYNNWLELLEDTIYAPEVWQAIKCGEDRKEKEKALNVAEKIVKKNLHNIYQAQNFEKIIVGARMEEEASRAGYKLQESGSCGISNSRALKNTGRLSSPFNFFFSGGKSEGKWEYHLGSCRVCHAESVEVGPCSVCKICERKFDSSSFE